MTDDLERLVEVASSAYWDCRGGIVTWADICAHETAGRDLGGLVAEAKKVRGGIRAALVAINASGTHRVMPRRLPDEVLENIDHSFAYDAGHAAELYDLTLDAFEAHLAEQGDDDEPR